jgi:hypothetical protein
MLLLPRLGEYRGRIRYRDHYKGPLGGAWSWVEENTARHRIAYTGTNKFYPLYRPDITNHVMYVPTGLASDDIPEDDRRYYLRWLRKVEAASVDYLFVCKMDDSTYMQRKVPYPIEKKWADAKPEIFEPVYSNDYVTIYEIRKSLLAEAANHVACPTQDPVVALSRQGER